MYQVFVVPMYLWYAQVRHVEDEDVFLKLLEEKNKMCFQCMKLWSVEVEMSGTKAKWLIIVASLLLLTS